MIKKILALFLALTMFMEPTVPVYAMAPPEPEQNPDSQVSNDATVDPAEDPQTDSSSAPTPTPTASPSDPYSTTTFSMYTESPSPSDTESSSPSDPVNPENPMPEENNPAAFIHIDSRITDLVGGRYPNHVFRSAGYMPDGTPVFILSTPGADPSDGQIADWRVVLFEPEGLREFAERAVPDAPDAIREVAADHISFGDINLYFPTPEHPRLSVDSVDNASLGTVSPEEIQRLNYTAWVRRLSPFAQNLILPSLEDRIANLLERPLPVIPAAIHIASQITDAVKTFMGREYPESRYLFRFAGELNDAEGTKVFIMSRPGAPLIEGQKNRWKVVLVGPNPPPRVATINAIASAANSHAGEAFTLNFSEGERNYNFTLSEMGALINDGGFMPPGGMKLVGDSGNDRYLPYVSNEEINQLNGVTEQPQHIGVERGEGVVLQNLINENLASQNPGTNVVTQNPVRIRLTEEGNLMINGRQVDLPEGSPAIHGLGISNMPIIQNGVFQGRMASIQLLGPPMPQPPGNPPLNDAPMPPPPENLPANVIDTVSLFQDGTVVILSQFAPPADETGQRDPDTVQQPRMPVMPPDGRLPFGNELIERIGNWASDFDALVEDAQAHNEPGNTPAERIRSRDQALTAQRARAIGILNEIDTYRSDQENPFTTDIPRIPANIIPPLPEGDSGSSAFIIDYLNALREKGLEMDHLAEDLLTQRGRIDLFNFNPQVGSAYLAMRDTLQGNVTAQLNSLKSLVNQAAITMDEEERAGLTLRIQRTEESFNNAQATFLTYKERLDNYGASLRFYQNHVTMTLVAAELRTEELNAAYLSYLQEKGANLLSEVPLRPENGEQPVEDQQAKINELRVDGIQLTSLRDTLPSPSDELVIDREILQNLQVPPELRDEVRSTVVRTVTFGRISASGQPVTLQFFILKDGNDRIISQILRQSPIDAFSSGAPQSDPEPVPAPSAPSFISTPAPVDPVIETPATENASPAPSQELRLTDICLAQGTGMGAAASYDDSTCDSFANSSEVPQRVVSHFQLFDSPRSLEFTPPEEFIIWPELQGFNNHDFFARFLPELQGLENHKVFVQQFYAPDPNAGTFIDYIIKGPFSPEEQTSAWLRKAARNAGVPEDRLSDIQAVSRSYGIAGSTPHPSNEHYAVYLGENVGVQSPAPIPTLVPSTTNKILPDPTPSSSPNFTSFVSPVEPTVQVPGTPTGDSQPVVTTEGSPTPLTEPSGDAQLQTPPVGDTDSSNQNQSPLPGNVDTTQPPTGLEPVLFQDENQPGEPQPEQNRNEGNYLLVMQILDMLRNRIGGEGWTVAAGGMMNNDDGAKVFILTRQGVILPRVFVLTPQEGLQEAKIIYPSDSLRDNPHYNIQYWVGGQLRTVERLVQAEDPRYGISQAASPNVIAEINRYLGIRPGNMSLNQSLMVQFNFLLSQIPVKGRQENREAYWGRLQQWREAANEVFAGLSDEAKQGLPQIFSIVMNQGVRPNGQSFFEPVYLVRNAQGLEWVRHPVFSNQAITRVEVAPVESGSDLARYGQYTVTAYTNGNTITSQYVFNMVTAQRTGVISNGNSVPGAQRRSTTLPLTQPPPQQSPSSPPGNTGSANTPLQTLSASIQESGDALVESPQPESSPGKDEIFSPDLSSNDDEDFEMDPWAMGAQQLPGTQTAGDNQPANNNLPTPTPADSAFEPSPGDLPTTDPVSAPSFAPADSVTPEIEDSGMPGDPGANNDDEIIEPPSSVDPLPSDDPSIVEPEDNQDDSSDENDDEEEEEVPFAEEGDLFITLLQIANGTTTLDEVREENPALVTAVVESLLSLVTIAQVQAGQPAVDRGDLLRRAVPYARDAINLTYLFLDNPDRWNRFRNRRNGPRATDNFTMNALNLGRINGRDVIFDPRDARYRNFTQFQTAVRNYLNTLRAQRQTPATIANAELAIAQWIPGFKQLFFRHDLQALPAGEAFRNAGGSEIAQGSYQGDRFCGVCTASSEFDTILLAGFGISATIIAPDVVDRRVPLPNRVRSRHQAALANFTNGRHVVILDQTRYSERMLANSFIDRAEDITVGDLIYQGNNLGTMTYNRPDPLAAFKFLAADRRTRAVERLITVEGPRAGNPPRPTRRFISHPDARIGGELITAAARLNLYWQAVAKLEEAITITGGDFPLAMADGVIAINGNPKPATLAQYKAMIYVLIAEELITRSNTGNDRLLNTNDRQQAAALLRAAFAPAGRAEGGLPDGYITGIRLPPANRSATLRELYNSVVGQIAGGEANIPAIEIPENRRPEALPAVPRGPDIPEPPRPEVLRAGVNTRINSSLTAMQNALTAMRALPPRIANDAAATAVPRDYQTQLMIIENGMSAIQTEMLRNNGNYFSANEADRRIIRDYISTLRDNLGAGRSPNAPANPNRILWNSFVEGNNDATRAGRLNEIQTMITNMGGLINQAGAQVPIPGNPSSGLDLRRPPAPRPNAPAELTQDAQRALYITQIRNALSVITDSANLPGASNQAVIEGQLNLIESASSNIGSLIVFNRENLFGDDPILRRRLREQIGTARETIGAPNYPPMVNISGNNPNSVFWNRGLNDPAARQAAEAARRARLADLTAAVLAVTQAAAGELQRPPTPPPAANPNPQTPQSLFEQIQSGNVQLTLSTTGNARPVSSMSIFYRNNSNNDAFFRINTAPGSFVQIPITSTGLSGGSIIPVRPGVLNRDRLVEDSILQDTVTLAFGGVATQSIRVSYYPNNPGKVQTLEMRRMVNGRPEAFQTLNFDENGALLREPAPAVAAMPVNVPPPAVAQQGGALGDLQSNLRRIDEAFNTIRDAPATGRNQESGRRTIMAQLAIIDDASFAIQGQILGAQGNFFGDAAARAQMRTQIMARRNAISGGDLNAPTNPNRVLWGMPVTDSRLTREQRITDMGGEIQQLKDLFRGLLPRADAQPFGEQPDAPQRAELGVTSPDANFFVNADIPELALNLNPALLIQASSPKFAPVAGSAVASNSFSRNTQAQTSVSSFPTLLLSTPSQTNLPEAGTVTRQNMTPLVSQSNDGTPPTAVAAAQAGLTEQMVELRGELQRLTSMNMNLAHGALASFFQQFSNVAALEELQDGLSVGSPEYAAVDAEIARRNSEGQSQSPQDSNQQGNAEPLENEQLIRNLLGLPDLNLPETPPTGNTAPQQTAAASTSRDTQSS